MDLSTNYLGLKLKNPLVPSASPLSREVDSVKRLEDAGAAAIVMYSLFEEQIRHEAEEIDHYLTTFNESYSEAMSYFPEPDTYHNLHAEAYLRHIMTLKSVVDIPVIASLNGVSPGGWMEYARHMEEAGADALELNIYYIPADPALTALEIENLYLRDIQAVKSAANIPLAVKVSPYFSAFVNMAMKMDKAGADGLVLFNRFYQPDIDLESLEIVPNLKLSSSYEIRLPLRWLAMLHGLVDTSLAATSGVHSAEDVIKLVMAGADVTMLASVLIKEGPETLTVILDRLKSWMDIHEYDSIAQMKGSMSYQSVAEPAALLRANYIKTLQSIR